MSTEDPLIPNQGGYRNLKSFRIAELVYDLTVRFCDQFISIRSRTHDQLVQAARSGVQNIAEGSQVSGTSKKSEMKLTNVARASLEELKRDYEDFLRQRGLPMFEPNHPALIRFKKRRCAALGEVQQWVAEERKRSLEEHGRTRTNTDVHRQEKIVEETQKPENSETATHEPIERPCSSVPVRVGPCNPVSSATLAANAALSLLNLACHLLDRQLASQAEKFKKEGGFTEALYRERKNHRDSR